jgi:hypothetical protein
MAARVRRVEYFYTTVTDRPGEAYKLLARLAAAEVNLLAFNCVPIGPESTELVLFPENVAQLARAAERSGLVLVGPHRAFLITGDNELGALVEIHRKLYDADINVYASSGVTDGADGYGYIVYVRPEKYDDAARVLDI